MSYKVTRVMGEDGFQYRERSNEENLRIRKVSDSQSSLSLLGWDFVPCLINSTNVTAHNNRPPSNY